MPKEQINTPARRTITEPTGSNGLKPGEFGLHFAQDGDYLHEGQHWENTPVLYVGWRAENGTPGGEGSMQAWMVVDADEVIRAADAIRESREADDVSTIPSWTFSTVVLSREDAQKAIRVLRRARDAAYGADE